MRIQRVFFISGILFLISGLSAAQFKSGESVDFKGDVKEDLYIGAGSISYNGNVTGDANIIGGDILFNGRVTEDAQFAGGNIVADINGADDVRLLGGQITATVNNKGDVFILAGEANLASGSDVAGDLYLMGGNIAFNGNVRGSVHAWGGEIKLYGKIGGNLEVRAETTKIQSRVKGMSKISSRHITVDPGAAFEGPVEYWSEDKVDFHETVKKGVPTLNEDLRGERDYGWKQHWFKYGFLFGFWFLISAAITMFLMLHFTPVILRQSAEKIIAAPVSAIGYGVLYFLLIPALALILFVTVIGMVHGFFLGAMFVFSIVFARPVSSIILTEIIAQRYKKTWSKWMYILVGLGVYLVLSILMGIPIVGGLINCLVVLVAIGGIINILLERYRASRGAKEKSA